MNTLNFKALAEELKMQNKSNQVKPENIMVLEGYKADFLKENPVDVACVDVVCW